MTQEQLNNERKIIDKIDEEIVTLLVSRFGVVERIKELKQKMNSEIQNPGREQEIINTLKDKNYYKHLQEIFNKIMEESRKIQQKQ